MTEVAQSIRDPAAADASAPADAAARSGRRLAILLMLGAIFGKALGFVREIMMAQIFGASMVADAFRAALTGTMLPLALFQNESVPAILIPTHRAWQSEGEAPRRFAALTVALTLIGIVIMILVEAFGAAWVSAIVGGFSPEAHATTLQLLEIMALSMPASVMLNVLASGEIALGRSRLTTIRSSLLNVSVIIGLITVYLTHRLEALAVSFAFAFNGLGAWGLWTLSREGTLNFRGLRWNDIVVAAADFWRKLLPLLFVPLADQGNIWVERILASRLSTGAVSSLDYARTITDSAVLFISQPLGLVLLSRSGSEDQTARLHLILRQLLIVSAPLCATLAIFAPDVARLVFARGAFNEVAVQMTGETMRGISVGLWASTIGWVMLRMLNSAGRNGTAVLILISAFVANIAINVVMFRFEIAHTYGSLMLGFGESIRGLVLLGATVVCLGLSYATISALLVALVPTAFTIALGLFIEGIFTGTLVRLSLASLSCSAIILLTITVTMPDVLIMGQRKCKSMFKFLAGRR